MNRKYINNIAADYTFFFGAFVYFVVVLFFSLGNEPTLFGFVTFG
jgi:hypothetical protein